MTRLVNRWGAGLEYLIFNGGFSFMTTARYLAAGFLLAMIPCLVAAIDPRSSTWTRWLAVALLLSIVAWFWAFGEFGAWLARRRARNA